MPTALRIGPYYFFFYSGDRTEPPHVQVERDDCKGKYWLDPVLLEQSTGFRRVDLRVIERLIVRDRTTLLEKWHGFFDN